MSKKQSQQKKIDKKGSSYVLSIIEGQMEGDFRPIFINHDYGFDCTINLFDKEDNYIPIDLKAQLKSGDSYFKRETNDEFEIYINKKDVSVWEESGTPVILIVYSVKNNKAYWVNIRKYIDSNEYNGVGGLNVKVQKKFELTKDSYNDFLEILYAEQKGLPHKQIKIYKQIYNFLLGKFDTLENDELKKYQEEYENKIKRLEDKDFFDEHKVSLFVNFALSQRRLFSLNNAILILEDLNHRLIYSKNKVNDENLENVYYYLIILYIEDNRFKDAEIFLEKLLKINYNFKKDEKRKYLLIKALLSDGLHKIDDALSFYDLLINDNKLKNIYLKGILCIFAGVLCRKFDEYLKAENYLKNSIEFVKSNKYLLAVAKTNLGALYHIMDLYDKAINYYNEAISLFKNMGDRSALAVLYRNLSNVNRKEKSYSSSFDLFRVSMQNKLKDDYDIIDDYKLDGHSNYSEEVYKKYFEGNKQLSYDYFDGWKSFVKAQNLCDHLGHLAGKNSLQYLHAKYLSILGQINNEFNLLSNALSYYIMVLYEDGIKNISKRGINNNEKEKFEELLNWVNEIKGDRTALIGRLIFYEKFSEYIPDDKINEIFYILLNSEIKGYNFHNDFDYGRYSVKALNRLAERLNKKQTKILLKRIQQNLKNEKWIVYEPNIELLTELNLQLLNKKEIIKIIDDTECLLSKIHNKYDVYQLWQKIIIGNDDSTISKIVFDRINKQYNHNLEKITFHEIVALSNSKFKSFRDIHLDAKIINYYCDSLLSESQRETIRGFGMGGFNFPSIVSRMYADVRKNLKSKIFDCLLKYISSENLIPYKRSKAVRAISSLNKRFLKSNIKPLHKILINIVEEDFSEIKKSYSKEGFFSDGYEYDYKELISSVIECLSKTDYENNDYLLDKLSFLLYDITKENTLMSIVKSLGEIGKSIGNDKKNLNKIISYLFQYSHNENVNVSNWSTFKLSQLIKKSDKLNIDMFVVRLKQLKYNNDDSVRRVVAMSCINLNKNQIKNKLVVEIINQLKNDISRKVRIEALKI